MDTALAFMMGEAHRNDPVMVFDWDKAARIIAEKSPKLAVAGLEGDFEYTSGVIWKDGKPYIHDHNTYLASTWATPLIVVDGEQIECWVYQRDMPEWGSETKWPESAIEILADEDKED